MDRGEVRYAKLEGVGFRFCKAPVEIRENGIICRDTVKGEDGKFTQVEGSETFYQMCIRDRYIAPSALTIPPCSP